MPIIFFIIKNPKRHNFIVFLYHIVFLPHCTHSFQQNHKYLTLLPKAVTLNSTCCWHRRMNQTILVDASVTVTRQTFRSLIAAVIFEPSTLVFIVNSQSVVITKAGASARVRSATNTISGFLTTT